MARPWEIHIPMGEKIKGFFFQNCLSLKEKKKKTNKLVRESRPPSPTKTRHSSTTLALLSPWGQAKENKGT